jgi:hypothetical protein
LSAGLVQGIHPGCLPADGRRFAVHAGGRMAYILGMLNSLFQELKELVVNSVNFSSYLFKVGLIAVSFF